MRNFNYFKNKAEAEILKTRYNFCVETSVNTIRTILCFQLNRIKLFLSLNGETSQQNEKTRTSYSKMFNANDSLMKGTCNT